MASGQILSVILAIIAGLPGILAYRHRNKAVSSRVEQVATQTAVQQFNLLYDEARKQVSDCRQECAGLRAENTSIRTELEKAREREDILEDKVSDLDDKVRELHRENTYLSEVLRRGTKP